MNTINTENKERTGNPPPATPTSRPILPDPNAELKQDYQPPSKPLTLFTVAELILKSPGRIIHEAHKGNNILLTGLCLCISIICLLGFGFTVGFFSGGAQLWAAPLKITTGVFFSALLCLPSLFVFSCLSGADSNLSRITSTLAGMITVSALLLMAFGPVSWIFAQSTDSIGFIGFMNLAFWIISIYYGIQFLKKSVVLLNGKLGKHLTIWTIIFVLVSLQMTTTLRPIIGKSENFLQAEKKFFLAHWIAQVDGSSPRHSNAVNEATDKSRKAEPQK